MSKIPLPTSQQPRPSSPLRPQNPRYPSDLSSSPHSHTRDRTTSLGMSSLSASTTNTRTKQSKRDEAIRKKIESELSRKRTTSTTVAPPGGRRRTAKAAPAKGTVAALKPSPALTVPENITVSDASQLCAAKRTDCVLVVDDEEGLSGIFTAKDLAFRVTAEGLDPRTTQVRQIMTPNPMVTRDTTSATEALQLMVQRGFRHLPVCNEEGNVVGLLDITKVFHEALDKIERGSSASQKLYSALEGVQTELGGTTNPQTAAMLAYVEALREKTAIPDLTSVMDSRTQPATVGPRMTVADAAKLMKQHRTTAVCVMEGGTNTSGGAVQGIPKIAGIFTSKDVVLRVIAAGLDPARVSVVRVMTPHPDVAEPTVTIHDALKKMYNGHYLNLPVVEADGRLVAIVDVLKLTYATLEQMNGLSKDMEGGDTEGGPMWGRFFESFGGHHDDEGSVISGMHGGTDLSHPVPNPFSTPSRQHLHHRNNSQNSPFSEVHPNDSASVVNEDEPSPIPAVVLSGGGAATVSNLGKGAEPIPVDDGTYVFKFRTPSGRTHRFQARHDDYEILRDIVSGKLVQDPYFTSLTIPQSPEIGNLNEDFPPLVKPDPNDFTLSYIDADGDTVLITTNSDVTDAVKVARAANSDRVVLLIQGGKGWAQAEKDGVAKAKKDSELAKKEAAEVDASTTAVEELGKKLDDLHIQPHAHHHHHDSGSRAAAADDLVFGVPRDLVLPASLGFLGVVIAGVFIATRVGSSSRY
ncbi:hypothetical protein FRC02_003089 [Tulasnella sp. 418]|nr:hypothetical protein FRC02_003089 [Tulasnella sp. 418]